MALPTGKAIDAAYLKTQLKNFDTVILENKYQGIIQYSIMPAASASNSGNIVQYIGTTNATYTNGYFYKSNGTAWAAVTTQAAEQEYTIKKAETADAGMSATYQLYKGSTAVGDKINVPKDWLLKDVTLKTCTVKDNPEIGFVVGDKYFDFEFNTKDVSATSTHVYLKVSELVDTYTGDKGISVDSATNKISVALAATPGLDIPTTGTDANKLGVKAGNGIEVTASGVQVKADTTGPISVGTNGVNVSVDTSLKVDSTSKKLGLSFETTNIDFDTEWE